MEGVHHFFQHIFQKNFTLGSGTPPRRTYFPANFCEFSWIFYFDLEGRHNFFIDHDFQKFSMRGTTPIKGIVFGKFPWKFFSIWRVYIIFSLAIFPKNFTLGRGAPPEGHIFRQIYLNILRFGGSTSFFPWTFFQKILGPQINIFFGKFLNFFFSICSVHEQMRFSGEFSRNDQNFQKAPGKRRECPAGWECGTLRINYSIHNKSLFLLFSNNLFFNKKLTYPIYSF